MFVFWRWVQITKFQLTLFDEMYPVVTCPAHQPLNCDGTLSQWVAIVCISELSRAETFPRSFMPLVY
jgi:hypothetical protein